MTTVQTKRPVIPLDRYSNFTRLQRVTVWILRFVHNCRASSGRTVEPNNSQSLTMSELVDAERYWILLSQQEHFSTEIKSLKAKCLVPKDSCLLPFRPFLDQTSILRVGGRESNAKLSYSKMHLIILHGKHPISKLIIRSEHLRLLHAGPTLLISSLNHRFHIICLRKTVRSVTRQCVICRRLTVRPHNQMLGQLPLERVTPGSVFEKVGVDYAGPFQIKYGFVRKPTIVKAYICIFVSSYVRAVHLELVSDLTAEAFLAALRRFIARRGHPLLIWSDHGMNFVGANREINELIDFLQSQKIQKTISEFCACRKIEWKFIPERSPHFGGLWEAAVKSTKTHLKRIIANVKLTYEEFSTVLTQIEACLNSRPLIPPNTADDDGIQALTPGHFLIGQPLMALPDPSFSYRSVFLLRRWHLCQNLVRHFWQRWSGEYLAALNRYNKWHYPSRNVALGDIVVLREDGTIPTNWPLARVIQTHPGKDTLVRVVTVKTANGIYKRPVSKIAVLIPSESN